MNTDSNSFKKMILTEMIDELDCYEFTPGPITGYEQQYLQADLSGTLDHLRANDHFVRVAHRIGYWREMYPILKASEQEADQQAADLILDWMSHTRKKVFGSDFFDDHRLCYLFYHTNMLEALKEKQKGGQGCAFCSGAFCDGAF